MDTNSAIADGGQRVCNMLGDHNTNQSKRSRHDAVREGVFENMRECFKGSESRFAQSAGWHTDHHSAFLQSAASLWVTHEFWRSAACASRPPISWASRCQCSRNEPTCM